MRVFLSLTPSFLRGGLELRGSMDQVQKRGSLNHGACFVLTQKKQIAEQRHAALSINQSIDRMQKWRPN